MTHSPRELQKPVFLAADLPWFSCLMTLKRQSSEAMVSRIFAVSSVEPSSTAITSMASEGMESALSTARFIVLSAW